MDSFVQQIAGLKISVKVSQYSWRKLKLILLLFAIFLIHFLNTITFLNHLNSCQNTLQFPMIAYSKLTYKPDISNFLFHSWVSSRIPSQNTKRIENKS